MAIYCDYSFLSLSFQHVMLMQRSPLHWSLSIFSLFPFVRKLCTPHTSRTFFFESPISLLVRVLVYTFEHRSKITSYFIFVDDIHVKTKICNLSEIYNRCLNFHLETFQNEIKICCRLKSSSRNYLTYLDPRLFFSSFFSMETVEKLRMQLEMQVRRKNCMSKLKKNNVKNTKSKRAINDAMPWKCMHR